MRVQIRRRTRTGTYTFLPNATYAQMLLQVHKLEDGSVAVFSRNSEDMSKKYPDLVEQLPRVSTHAV